MSSASIKKFSTVFVISLFILFFLILRGYKIEESSLWIDEGYSINASLSILEKGVPLLDSESFYRQGILYNYISAGLMGLFGFDAFSPTTARIPALIFGVLSIFSLFLLTKRLFNKNVALLSSLLLGFSTWHIAWSQQARGYTGLMLFIILSFYFLYSFLKEKSPKDLFFFSLSFLCAYLSHTMAIIFVPSFVIIIITYTILHSNSLSLRSMLLRPQRAFRSLLSFLSPLLSFPRTRESISHLLKTLATIFSLSLFSYIIYTSLPKIKVYGFYRDYLAFISDEMLLFAIISLAGIILGIFSKRYFWPSLFLLIAFLFPLLIVLEYGPMAHMRYLFPLFPFAIIFFSLAIFKVLDFVWNSINYKLKIDWKLRIENWKLAIAFTIAIVLFLPHLTFLPQKHYPLKWGSPQPNFKEAYSIIEKEKKEGDIIISPYTHLSKIYLDNPGIWFPISLPGRETDMEKLTARGMDYYTGAPLIESKEEFLETLSNESGFVILDMMATIRIRNQFEEERLAHPKIEEIYQSGTGLNAIWLYRF